MDSSTYDFAPTRFFDWIEHGLGEAGKQTLARLTRESVTPPFPTPMIADVSRALETPALDLTCKQVRLLVSHGCALRVLAAPAIVFAEHYPDADFGLYPADFLFTVIQSLPTLAMYDPAAARRLAAFDVALLAWKADIDEATIKRAAKELERARQMIAPLSAPSGIKSRRGNNRRQ